MWFKFVSSAAAVEPKKKFVILLFVFVSFPVVLFDLFCALAGIFLGGFLTSFVTWLDLKVVGFALKEIMGLVKIENNFKDLPGFSSFL